MSASMSATFEINTSSRVRGANTPANVLSTLNRSPRGGGVVNNWHFNAIPTPFKAMARVVLAILGHYRPLKAILRRFENCKEPLTV